jgi:hypothetical protein
VPAAGELFLVMENERGADQLTSGLGEPQENLGRGQHDYRRGDVRHGLPAIVTELASVYEEIFKKTNKYFVSLTIVNKFTLSP